VAKFTGIRSQLLGLVAAAVVPFLVLIGAGLWNQSRTEQAAAKNRALVADRRRGGRAPAQRSPA
jgi:hypothetical protein